jgi:hypothetical protein
MKAKAYWAGDLEAGGLIVAAETPAQARAFVARVLFEQEDYPHLRAWRMRRADALIDADLPVPHYMARYEDLRSLYRTED